MDIFDELREVAIKIFGKDYIETLCLRRDAGMPNFSVATYGIQYGEYSVYDNIKIPVLVIHGTEDESISIESSQKLIKHLKNSKLITLEGSDHRYSKPDDFEKVISETSKFLIEELK